MSALDLKIPPVALLFGTGAAMAALAWALPGAALSIPARPAIGGALALAGLGICGAGVVSFRRAGTTVNPMTPEASSALVETGIYAYTRNPMYLAFATLLAGWAVGLANGASLALLPLFVFYIDLYQIRPEERALAAHFGAAFASYAGRVGRWL
jgi:protein-S-isoprenylcysteine O-methyltransferase Ste14